MAETATASRLLSAAEFAALPDDGRRLELVRGEVTEMTAPGIRHGAIAARLIGALQRFVDDRALGLVTSEAGCWLERDPDTVRVPDGAYWPSDSFAGAAPIGFAEPVPALVLEVVSPNDSRPEIYRKVSIWLAAGVRVVWVVWPESGSLHIIRDDADPLVLGTDDTLTCDDLLPGFALPLATVFAGLPAAEGRS